MSLLCDGARLSLTTFTVLPAGAPPTDRRTAGVAMALAPLAGVVVALPAASALYAASWGDGGSGGRLLPAALAVVTTAAVTRGLHLDGLADTADGLGSMQPPDTARQIMRKSDVGPLGVVTLVLTLLTQVAALASASRSFGPVALSVAVVTGRLAVTLACTRGIPAADPDGLGAAVAGTVRRAAAVAVAAAVLCAAVAAAGLTTGVEAVSRCASARRWCSRSPLRMWCAGTAYGGSAASPATCSALSRKWPPR